MTMLRALAHPPATRTVAYPGSLSGWSRRLGQTPVQDCLARLERSRQFLADSLSTQDRMRGLAQAYINAGDLETHEYWRSAAEDWSRFVEQAESDVAHYERECALLAAESLPFTLIPGPTPRSFQIAPRTVEPLPGVPFDEAPPGTPAPPRAPVATVDPRTQCPPGQFWDGRICRGSVGPLPGITLPFSAQTATPTASSYAPALISGRRLRMGQSALEHCVKKLEDARRAVRKWTFECELRKQIAQESIVRGDLLVHELSLVTVEECQDDLDKAKSDVAYYERECADLAAQQLPFTLIPGPTPRSFQIAPRTTAPPGWEKPPTAAPYRPVASVDPRTQCPPGQFWDGRMCRGSVGPMPGTTLPLAAQPAPASAAAFSSLAGRRIPLRRP